MGTVACNGTLLPPPPGHPDQHRSEAVAKMQGAGAPRKPQSNGPDPPAKPWSSGPWQGPYQDLHTAFPWLRMQLMQAVFIQSM